MRSRPSTRWTNSRMRARPVSSSLSCASLSIPPSSWQCRPPNAVWEEARRRSTVKLDPRERLIVALDVPSVGEAETLVTRLGGAVSFYKSGYQLAFAGGIDFARVLASAGKRIFLDLKLHDIGNTVAKGVEGVARLGASFLSVHAYPQTMHAAVDARKGSPLRLLAVTVLTSYDDADLAAAGYDFTVSELVRERAAQARDVGIDGLVCSGEETAMLRPIVGAGMVLVTPGIRPAGAAAGDQKRIMTPGAAIAAGADHLVVGRPILAAPDPQAAAEAIIAEIAAATAREGGGDAQGLFDSAHRCHRSERIQGLHGRNPCSPRQVWRPRPSAWRNAAGRRGEGPLPQRATAISRL